MNEFAPLHLALSQTPHAVAPAPAPAPAPPALRLTPFEQYMLLDDRADYPMSFFIPLEFTGELDRDAFEAALRETLARHPLLTSVVQTIGWRSCWVPSDRPVQVQWHSGEAFPETDDRPAWNLGESPLLRIWARVGDGNSAVLLEFHHCATDGLGALRFIGDLLGHYGCRTAACTEDRPELAPVSPALLKARGDLPERVPLRKVIPEFVDRFWQIVTQPATPVLPPAVAPTAAEAARQRTRLPPFVTWVLDRPDVLGLQKAAAARGVTQNDLLGAAMFRTLADWNLRRGADPSQYFWMGMPASLRTISHDDSPAANILTYMPLKCRLSDCDDPESLLQAVHRHTTHDLRTDVNGLFIRGLKPVCHVPGLLWLITRSHRCFASAILSNVGEARRQFGTRFPQRKGRIVAGNVVLDALRGASPVRPGTRIATALGTYAGRMFISTSFDASLFSAAQAQLLLDGFVDRLLAFGRGAGTDSSGAPRKAA